MAITQGEALRIYAIDSRKLERTRQRIFRDAHGAKATFARRIEAALSDLVTEDGAITSERLNLDRLDDMLPELRTELNRIIGQDYREELEASVRNRFGQYDTFARKLGLPEFGEGAERFDDVQNRLRTIAEATDAGTERAMQRIRDTLAGARYSAANSQGPSFAALKATLISEGGVAPAYAGQVGNTMLFSIDRFLTKEQTKRAGLRKQRYTGPVDSLTRDFCLRWVGEVREVQFWESLENDTGPQPVSDFGGGWGPCRHRLLAWSDDWEL